MLRWHAFGYNNCMKVVKLQIGKTLTPTDRLVKLIIERDFDAFKSTKYQFLRNNQAYSPYNLGMIA